MIRILRGQQGFTLLELLAVMAIIAVLAGIVAASVSGSGESSTTAAAQQDGSTATSSSAEFFADQTGAEVLTPSTVVVTTAINGDEVAPASTPTVQTISSRWPEQYIAEDDDNTGSAIYALEFPTTEITSAAGDVVNVIIVDSNDAIIDRSTLMTGYAAIDFQAMVTLGFMQELPASSTSTSGVFHNFLWLFKKQTSASGSGTNDSRAVTVFKLASVQENELGNSITNAGDVTLTYVQIF